MRWDKVGKMAGVAGRMAYPVINAATTFRKHVNTVNEKVNANTGGGTLFGLVGTVVKDTLSGKADPKSAVVGAVAGATVGLSKTVWDSAVEHKVVDSMVKLGQATVRAAWDYYTD